MNIKCDVIEDAWLGQTGCEVGSVLFTQTIPAAKLQVFVSNKISITRI